MAQAAPRCRHTSLPGTHGADTQGAQHPVHPNPQRRTTMKTRTQSLAPNIGPRALRMLLATMVVAVAGAWSQAALASPHGSHGSHGGPEMHGGRGMPGGAMGGMGLMGGPRMVERMLDTVNATAEQRAQVKQILQAAQSEMQVQHESGRKLHQQGQALFAQPTVDARAAEALRLQMVAQHDQASKRMMQTMLDVSRVLTPEQRKTLSDRMAQRRAMMERHRGERQSMERPPK
jgi:periplasmic protein CpxP/Spy